ncbi:inositol hexakisphosphate and diphosphoinositol-pentakisphosphate kinase 2-like isoform X3 [Oratosquilla oratoria]|uniref:inositol hexakisphosphate and diphosphoinositol-pentakisphosphate kinase 2-like isoform X3 n=1 Tax=Oratosquilla oratoria TaxID=337810 RepID=UPI003F75BDE0
MPGQQFGLLRCARCNLGVHENIMGIRPKVRNGVMYRKDRRQGKVDGAPGTHTARAGGAGWVGSQRRLLRASSRNTVDGEDNRGETMEGEWRPDMYATSSVVDDEGRMDEAEDEEEEDEEDMEGVKQVVVGICAMEKKSASKPMIEILTRLEEFEYIRTTVFPEHVILKEPVERWPLCDCLVSFHSKGFPLEKAIDYANLRRPYVINNLAMQYDLQQDRRQVYSILQREGIELPRFAILDRDSSDPSKRELIEGEDHVEVNGVIFNKPFVEKPVSAEDHNIYIYYPTSAGGGSQRLFRKIGSRSSVYSPESRVRKMGSYIYEDFMPTDGTDVKVYTVGPDYAHAEARKSPALDGKVERDSEGKEVRYPVILSNTEKLIARKVCIAFKQTVCGFDLLRANGKSYVCDVNGFSFVKNSSKYYDDCAKILGNMILRELAPYFHIPWTIPFQLDDPPFVPTTLGKMMELRCVVAVIRHGDRTPKQKMKMEVRHPKFFELFARHDGYKDGHIKLKKPKQLQEVLDIARGLLAEIEQNRADPETEEKKGKLEQLKSVLEIFLKDLSLQEESHSCLTYGHFSGINRKVQLKYQPRGWKRRSSSEEGDSPREPSLVLILKWGGELTPAGRIQAEELGRLFRCMYPGGQERSDWVEESVNGCEYAGTQGLGLLRLHSTYRHDLKIYASDEGRVQMTAAAFAKGLLALEGELTPILVQMVKSANTNGLLDNDCDSYKHQNMVKNRLHEAMQQDRELTSEDHQKLNPTNSRSISNALHFIKNPVKMCQHVHSLIQQLNVVIKAKKEDPKTKDVPLYHGETWELMQRRWAKLEKDFMSKNKVFDISKIPDIYDCIKYDLQHNHHTLHFEQSEALYKCAKYLADVVIPQEYGITKQEKIPIGQGICTPLLKKIRADLHRNIEEESEDNHESINRLNPIYSRGVSSPGRHVRTRLYFTSESHIHSLLTVLRFGGLLDEEKDEQWSRAMDYVGAVSELNYLSQIVIMLYEDPTKDPSSDNRFHVELHFSPGVNCCVHKNLPPGPGFRPHSRNEPEARIGMCPFPRAHARVPLSPKAETEGKVQRSPSRIDEEDLHYFMEDPEAHDEKFKSKGTTKEAVRYETEAGVSCVPILQPVPSKNRKCEEGIVSHDGLLTPPVKVPQEKYTEFPEGEMQLGGVDGLDGEVLTRKSEPIAISARSHSDCGLVALPVGRPYPIKRSLSDGASSYQRSLSSSDAVARPRSLEAENSLAQQHTPKVEKGSSSLDSVNDEEGYRKHRHSIPGHGYLAFLAGLQQKAANLPVFSTAVISGSTSAPDLRDNYTHFTTNLEGLVGGVPSIRPLETLHNALSLRQLDAFLERITSQYRTPMSSPPKMPSTPRHLRSHPPPLGLQSPSSSVGWSGPPSFVSSSGPSSPNMNTLDFFSHHRSSDATASSLTSSCASVTSTHQPGPTSFATALPSHTSNAALPPYHSTTSSVTSMECGGGGDSNFTMDDGGTHGAELMLDPDSFSSVIHDDSTPVFETTCATTMTMGTEFTAAATSSPCFSTAAATTFHVKLPSATAFAAPETIPDSATACISKAPSSLPVAPPDLLCTYLLDKTLQHLPSSMLSPPGSSGVGSGGVGCSVVGNGGRDGNKYEDVGEPRGQMDGDDNCCEDDDGDVSPNNLSGLASPSEGSESFGSYSQTEAESVIECEDGETSFLQHLQLQNLQQLQPEQQQCQQTQQQQQQQQHHQQQQQQQPQHSQHLE